MSCNGTPAFRFQLRTIKGIRVLAGKKPAKLVTSSLLEISDLQNCDRGRKGRHPPDHEGTSPCVQLCRLRHSNPGFNDAKIAECNLRSMEVCQLRDAGAACVGLVKGDVATLSIRAANLKPAKVLNVRCPVSSSVSTLLRGIILH